MLNTDTLADLCAELGQALHAAGAPVHRIETSVDRVRAAYGCQGATVASPTALWVQVERSARILRLEPGDMDLSRMVAVLRLVDRLERDPGSPDQARRLLERLLDRPPVWGTLATQLAFVTTSAAAAVLLGGGVADVGFSAVAGALAMGVLGRIGTGSAWFPLRTVVLAFLLGLLGVLGSVFGASASVVALSGAILILPGLSLTMAVTEVSAGHWSAGSARLLGVAVVLAELAVGVLLAWWPFADLQPLLAAVPLSEDVVRAIPLMAPAMFGVLLQVRAVDLPPAWLTAILGWVVAGLVGGVPGAAAGGLVVALAAGLIGRVNRIPDLVLILPGILMLVPGSIGVRGVEQLLTRDLVTGIDTGLLALETAGAIAAGVLAGQALVRPLVVWLDSWPMLPKRPSRAR